MALRAQGGIIIISLELLISIHARPGDSQRREFHISFSPLLREDAAAAENGDNEMNMMNRE